VYKLVPIMRREEGKKASHSKSELCCSLEQCKFIKKEENKTIVKNIKNEIRSNYFSESESFS